MAALYRPSLSRPLRAVAALAALFAATLVFAQQQSPKLEPLPDIPPPPKLTNTPDDPNEPQVTIRQESGSKIEEYRAHGRVYAIRVTPKIGKPYLLIDPDGKGTMTKAEDIGGGVKPPQWVLFEF